MNVEGDGDKDVRQTTLDGEVGGEAFKEVED